MMPNPAHIPYREHTPKSNGRQQSPHAVPIRTLTVQRLGFTTAPTLRIRLVGQWLAAAGFHAGTPVTVKVEYQQLVIVPAPQEGA